MDTSCARHTILGSRVLQPSRASRRVVAGPGEHVCAARIAAPPRGAGASPRPMRWPSTASRDPTTPAPSSRSSRTFWKSQGWHTRRSRSTAAPITTRSLQPGSLQAASSRARRASGHPIEGGAVTGRRRFIDRNLCRRANPLSPTGPHWAAPQGSSSCLGSNHLRFATPARAARKDRCPGNWLGPSERLSAPL
jgi:hypothetical protein